MKHCNDRHAVFLITRAAAASAVTLFLASCGGGGGDDIAATPSTDLVRAFSSGTVATPYTVTVRQPGNLAGAQILVPALANQTAFQYFNQNIAQAIASHAASVTFPNGAYSIAPEAGSAYHVMVSGASDLVIDGQGSTLTFTGVVGGDATGTVQGIVLKGNQRVVLKNFIIKYDVRIASSGSVLSESAHCGGVTHQYVAIDTATYPMTDPRIGQAKVFNDSTVDLWGTRANEYYTMDAPVNLQDGNAFFPCSNGFDHAFPTVGHRVTVRHFAYDGNAIGVDGPNSADVTLQDLTIYNSPSTAIFVGNGFTRGVAIEGVKVVKDPADPNQLVTLAADALHFNNVAGDIIVEHSEFSFQGDDGLNIITSIPLATAVTGNQVTIPLSAQGSFGLNSSSVGDVFAFYAPDFTYRGTATLQALARGTDLVATFNTLPGVAVGDHVLNQAQAAARVYIADNNFHDNRGRGVITRATGVYIADNSFTHDSGPAIWLGTDGLEFMEGPFARDVTVSGNTISASNQTQVWVNTSTGEFGAISIGIGCPVASGCANKLSPKALIGNILIRDNAVSASAGIGILLSNVGTATVDGNTVVDSASAVLQSSFGGGTGPAGSVHVTRSTGVTVGTNTLARPATSN